MGDMGLHESCVVYARGAISASLSLVLPSMSQDHFKRETIKSLPSYEG